MPVFAPGPTTRIGARAHRSAKSSYSRTSAGTVEERQIASTASRSSISPSSAPSSSLVRFGAGDRTGGGLRDPARPRRLDGGRRELYLARLLRDGALREEVIAPQQEI